MALSPNSQNAKRHNSLDSKKHYLPVMPLFILLKQSFRAITCKKSTDKVSSNSSMLSGKKNTYPPSLIYKLSPQIKAVVFRYRL